MVKTSYGKTYKSSVLYAYSAVMFVACGFLCFGCFNESWFYLQSTSPQCLGGRSFYFNARKGFGSDIKCVSNQNPTYLCPGPNAHILCDDFCFEWACYGDRHHYPYYGSIWKGIDLSTDLSNMYSETMFLWPLLFGCVILSCVLAFFSCMLLRSVASSLSSNSNLAMDNLTKYIDICETYLDIDHPSSCQSCLYFTSHINYCPQNTAVLLSFFSCLLSSVSIFSLLISNTMNANMWEIFFQDMLNTVGGGYPLDLCKDRIYVSFTRYGWFIIVGSALTAFTSYTMMWIGVHFNRHRNDNVNTTEIGADADADADADMDADADTESRVEDLTLEQLCRHITVNSSDDQAGGRPAEKPDDWNRGNSSDPTVTTSAQHPAVSFTSRNRTFSCCWVDVEMCCNCLATDA